MARRSQVAFASGETDEAAMAVPVIARGPVTAAAATTPARSRGRDGADGMGWRPDIRGLRFVSGFGRTGPGRATRASPGNDAGERDDVTGTVTEPRPSV